MMKFTGGVSCQLCQHSKPTLAQVKLRAFPPGAPLRRGGVTKKNVGPRSAPLRPHILGNFGGCAWFQGKNCKVVAAQKRVREMLLK